MFVMPCLAVPILPFNSRPLYCEEKDAVKSVTMLFSVVSFDHPENNKDNEKIMTYNLFRIYAVIGHLLF